MEAESPSSLPKPERPVVEAFLIIQTHSQEEQSGTCWLGRIQSFQVEKCRGILGV